MGDKSLYDERFTENLQYKALLWNCGAKLLLLGNYKILDFS